MIEEELVEEEPVEEGREDMANDHGRERQSTGRQSIVKGKGLSIGLLSFFFFFFFFKCCADMEICKKCIGFGFRKGLSIGVFFFFFLCVCVGFITFFLIFFFFNVVLTWKIIGNA